VNAHSLLISEPFRVSLVVAIVLTLTPSLVTVEAMQRVPWRPSVFVEALEPAEIEFGQEIQTILVVDRYRPRSVGKKLVKNIEGVFTGEWVGEDKKGAKAAIAALVEGLDRSPRFGVVNPEIKLPGSGTEFLPAPLPAHEVRRLCNEYSADALVAIEAFDSDHDTDKEEKKTGLFGLGTKEVYEREANVEFGWRFYDGATGYLLDEYEGTDSVLIEKRNQDDLPTTAKIVKHFGTGAGRTYARRIAPTIDQILLSFHGKGSDRLKAGKKLAKKGKWGEAERLWMEEVDNPDFKVRGRAAHNVAVAHEVLGDLQGALEWATIASHEYANEVAWEYYEELSMRVENRRRAEAQLAAGVRPEEETEE